MLGTDVIPGACRETTPGNFHVGAIRKQHIHKTNRYQIKYNFERFLDVDQPNRSSSLSLVTIAIVGRTTYPAIQRYRNKVLLPFAPNVVPSNLL